MLMAKDKEIQSLTFALTDKRVIEGRLLKVQNELSEKDQEISNLKHLLTKAQNLILKLQPGSLRSSQASKNSKDYMYPHH
jgi:hypothetical protein